MNINELRGHRGFKQTADGKYTKYTFFFIVTKIQFNNLIFGELQDTNTHEYKLITTQASRRVSAMLLEPTEAERCSLSHRSAQCFFIESRTRRMCRKRLTMSR